MSQVFADGSHTWWNLRAAQTWNNVDVSAVVDQLGASLLVDGKGNVRRLDAYGQDDHFAAGFLFVDGKPPIAAWTRHLADSVIRVRKGTVGGLVDSLGPESTISASAATSYAQFWHQPSTDNLWLVSRVGSSTSRFWSVWKSTNYGSTWSSQQNLISGNRPYIVSSVSGSRVNCAAYSHPDEADNRVWFFTIDLSTGDIDTADGTNIGNLDGTNLPLTMTTDLDLAYTAPNGVRLFDVSDGATPRIVVGTWSTDTDTTYRVVTWSGSAWGSEELVAAGVVFGFTASTHYNGGASFMPGSTDVVLSRESSGTWYLEKWADSSGYSKTADIASSASCKLVRPLPSSSSRIAYLEIDSYTSFDDWVGCSVRFVDV